MDKNLYAKLAGIRANIKNKERAITGRAPVVCSDDALYAIADLEPTKLSDLEGVPGVGHAFIENYGQMFVDAVNDFVKKDEESVLNISSTAESTLKELEKKLVSINRRNRLLYMPKLSNKYAFDLLADAVNSPFDIIFGSNDVTIADLSSPNEKEGKKYRSAVSLLREIDKDLRDKGQNDLYIGYPFVIGRIPGENFDIRCPLALFPVKANRTSTKITVSYDESRDALYNTTLILAYFKFNNITKPLPEAVIDDLTKETFLSNLYNFYLENDIKLDIKENTLSRFKEYKASEFPKFNSGEMYLIHNVILGKYPVCSSSIQKDFDEILAMGQITTNLNELLLEVNDWNYDSDAFYGDTEEIVDDKPFDISEKDLFYINDLDSSQENVLTAINNLDKLVIQGPPGTGKSQVITSLIAEFAQNDKTVLMVSEKKTALDVVYSRLGRLSDYAIMIDDTSNKDLFYKQLEKMFNLSTNNATSSENVADVSSYIDARIKLLEELAGKLYRPNDFGIEPYKLYIQSKKINLTDSLETQRVQKIHEMTVGQIHDIKYAELTEIYRKCSNRSLLEQMSLYYRISHDYEWLSSTKPGLNQFEVMDAFSMLDEYKASFEEYQGMSFFNRLFEKGKLKKKALVISERYFDINQGDIVDILMRDPDNIRTGFNQYIAYDECDNLFKTLTSNEQRYIFIILKNENLFNSLQEANSYLYNAILYEHIVEFENNNREILQTINQYGNVVEELSELIRQKKTLTRKRLEEVLSHNMTNMTYAKRRGEMQRVIESKRKWSVNRFISKYSFELFKAVKVWLLTPEVVSEIMPLEKGLFDLVIFDEASQMYIERGLPTIYRAKKVVIAGDHKQLRPSSLGSGRMEMDEEELPDDIDSSAALEEESLLDLARFKYRDVMLNFHYRSKYEELIAFSNYAFYKGRLYVSPNADKPEKPPIEFHKMSDAMWVNRSNLQEAKFIVALLKDVLRNRTNEETIGIITFNSNQRDLIMDLIEEQCAVDQEFAVQIHAEMDRVQDGEDIGLFVKNIESVQGDERDIIIFSIGYAKNENGRLVRNFGWLNQRGGENRLNVAISRAKTKVHVVASFEPEELQVEDTKNEGPKILKKYLQYAKAVSMRDSEAAQQILYSFGDDSNPGESVSFDSDFENQVYNALYDRLGDKGYTIDTQVGIGGYSIDQAIKKDGKYLLGIECDGKMYHSSKSARERDYHRQKYLESRGWRIHRIWSTNWWKNPNGEINKIVNLVENL